MKPDNSILITGCSSGIGLAAAKRLHQLGYQVFATCRKPEDVSKLQALGLEAYALDICDSAMIAKVLDEILAKTQGTLDALFNNAGIVQAGAIEDLSLAAIRQQFETNVFGQIEMIKAVLPIMRKQRFGRIVQNSSILGQFALPYRGAYNASKFAIEGFIDTLRLELAKTPIEVILIEPGAIKTSLRDNAKLRFQQNINSEQSLHRENYQNMLEHFFARGGRLNQALSPEAVVKVLVRALTSPHPKARYYIGLPAHLIACFKRWAPTALQDWLALTIFRGETRPAKIP